jgi:Tfp pilus assembly PilM family ATPase/Tfp pilus assembly protein PilN
MNVSVVLEIGNPWLKIAVFRPTLSVTYLKSVAAFNIANISEDAVAQVIADYFKDLQVRRFQNIIISFSRNAVTLRNLRIPSANPSEVDDMIKLHVGRQVPYAKEEIVNGYRIIGHDAMGYSKVMLAIVHRENIRKIFRILEKAGLYTDRIELSSDGILSWLCRAVKTTQAQTQEVFIILDIDFNFTDFVVSSYENILFSRAIAQGAELLMDESKWPKFIGEMKQTIVISQGEEVMAKPSRIYVTGAAENLKNFASTVELEFNIPTQVVEPLTNLPLAKEIGKKPPDLFQHASFSALLGLGLDTVRKKINFVLPEAQIRRALRERSRDSIFLGSTLMYLILIICGIYLEKLHNRQAYLELLTDRYKKIATQSEDLGEKVERLRKIKSKQDTKSVVLNYLLEVSKLLPSEIVITSLSFVKDDRLDLKGRAVEMSDIFKFITTLENSPYFKDIQTRYTTRKKIKGKDTNEFELICPFENIASSKKNKEKKPAEGSPSKTPATTDEAKI